MNEEPTQFEKDEADFQAELRKWDALQIDLAQFPVAGGLVKLSLRVDAIAQILVEKGICTVEEFNHQFLKEALKSLPVMREQITPAVQEAKLMAIRNGQLRKQ